MKLKIKKSVGKYYGVVTNRGVLVHETPYYPTSARVRMDFEDFKDHVFSALKKLHC